VRTHAAKGTVKIWHADLGWGVLISRDVDREIWAHFSAIDSAIDPSGYRELYVGDSVEFRYHRGHQDGYRYVADSVHRL
jgi:cold shock protein